MTNGQNSISGSCFFNHLQKKGLVVEMDSVVAIVTLGGDRRCYGTDPEFRSANLLCVRFPRYSAWSVE